ncbi:acyl-CoA synthetase FdrA [bacterium]|nr:acyl-CoA synthetase FdrA [bacterium]
MTAHIFIRKNEYYDSVSLMLISKRLSGLENFDDCSLMMGTTHNIDILKNAGYKFDNTESITPNDLIIAVSSGEENPLKKITDEMELIEQEKNSQMGDEFRPSTITSALKSNPDMNFVLISVPGEHAAYEAQLALDSGLHVMLFSDNVTVEEEVSLKKSAREKGLLMMGPDCGTAIINGLPLGFANVVKKGKIGIVGASGTGIQEISAIIGRFGGGITHAIGLGGRDLKEGVGGIMMEMGIDALMQDDETEIIVLCSKPPAHDIADKIIKKVENSKKPVIINFLGDSREDKNGIVFCKTLEDTGLKALELAGIKTDIVDVVHKDIDLKGKFFTGLYTGGTLTAETLIILSEDDHKIYGNVQKNPELYVSGWKTVKGHNLIDLGEDEFTKGKPHPMIDPSERNNLLVREAKNPDVGVVIMDFVLGFGSHMDPVGAMEKGIFEARKIDPDMILMASITGTHEDPQNFNEQKKKLEDYGVLYFNTNAEAVRFLKKSL